MLIQKHNGKIETKFLWLILFILGISKSIISNEEGKKEVYALHLTPFLSFTFHFKEPKERQSKDDDGEKGILHG